MECGFIGCKEPPTHCLQQKQGGRTNPCRVLACCEEHTPEWANAIGVGETRWYYVWSINFGEIFPFGEKSSNGQQQPPATNLGCRHPAKAGALAYK